MSEEEIIELSQEELAAIEAERLIEVARVQDLKDRISSLYDKRVVEAALDISNIDLYIKKNIFQAEDKVLAEVIMKQFEAADESGRYDAESVKYIESRKSAYRSIEEVIHIVLDHGIDSQEFMDLQNERASIKARYPKK